MGDESINPHMLINILFFPISLGYDHQPWFMYMPVFAPHGPFEAPDYWVSVAKSQAGGSYDSVTFGAMMIMIDDLMGTLVSTLKEYSEWRVELRRISC